MRRPFLKGRRSLYNQNMFTEEKKVEFIELVYDLIFVYLIGRSNGLLHDMDGGFFTIGTYIVYLLSALTILQIWYQSTLFINRFGSNSMTDYLGLFINMYLLYYMAGGTRNEWGEYYMRYNIAWGLILLNLAVQYYLKMRKNGKVTPWDVSHIKARIVLLLVQAGLIFASVPVYYLTRFPLSWVSLIVGFFGAVFTRKIDALVPVNFEHLTERVMLYVVLTFGEMIVSIAVYFDDPFSFNTLYFSVMAFLIVAGLFLSYGLLYDHIIDRTMHSTGSAYIILHVFLLLALSNITAALEFMPDETVNSIPKNMLITASFVVYYVFLFFIAHYARECDRPTKGLILRMGAACAVFVILIAVFYQNGYISIALSAVYVCSMFGLMHYVYKRKNCSRAHS